MYGDSIFKIIINSIKNFFKIIATLVATLVTSIFGYKKKYNYANDRHFFSENLFISKKSL